MAMMKKAAVAVLILCVIFSSLESVKPDAFDCYDGCITACVQPNTRVMRRCELKCGIECGPDSKIEDRRSK